jgi:hypothetical protein
MFVFVYSNENLPTGSLAQDSIPKLSPSLSLNFHDTKIKKEITFLIVMPSNDVNSPY